MDSIKTAQELLAKLQKEYGLDPQEVVESAAAYLVTLGLSVIRPTNGAVKRRIEEGREPEGLSALLDEVNEEGRKALARRNLASELGWAVAQIVRNIVVKAVVKGG